MDFKLDTLDPELNFSIDEAATEVDGVNILAKIKGEFFCPNGYSRNSRFYPKALWEKVLATEDVKQSLKDRTMFGCISHKTPINDESFRDGKFSHIIIKMEIDSNGKGMGEALVINTPTGRILNTIARAGSKMYVSTRADGAYKGETSEGIPIVDKDKYKYYTTDFVLKPGFLQANPELAEEFNNIEDNNTTEENEMTEKLLKSLTEENGNLRVDIAAVSKSHEDLKKSTADTSSENVALKEEIDRLIKVEEAANKDSETLETTSKELEEYKKIDTPELITKALDMAEEKIDAYQALGTVEDITTTVAEHKEVSEKIEELGGMDSIDKTIDIAETLITEKEEVKNEATITELAKELNVTVEAIKKVYGKMTEDEIKDLFKNLKEEKPADDDGDDDDEEDAKKKKDKKDKEAAEALKQKQDEEGDLGDTTRKSSCSSLMESFSKI